VAKPNYQRDKRQRDLARQHKQEEKRQQKAQKRSGVNIPPESPEASTSEEPETLVPADGPAL
jgi:hypothetical protein